MKKIEDWLGRVKKKRIAFIFPHPDDESVMSAGLIQRALDLGFDVSVAIITEGSRGKIFVHGRGRSAYEIRRSEMANAMSILGVRDWVMWRFEDGFLKNTKQWRLRLTRYLEAIDPGVVVTYDFSGVTGHPDHVSLSRFLKKEVMAKETKLLWVAFDEERGAEMISNQVGRYASKPDLVLKLNFIESVKKWRAAYSHKSQNLISYLKKPWWWLSFSSREEWYSIPKLGKKYKYRYIRFRI